MGDRSENVQDERRAFSTPGAGGLMLAGDEQGPARATPVLLLHGGGQNRHAWRRTAQRLAAAGYFAVSIDARGHGDSAWSAEGHYDMAHFAEDLHLVLQRFDRAPVVVGASMGGMSALLAQAGAAGQLFTAVVLVDVTPRMELAGVQRIMGFMRANPDGFATLAAAADAIAAYNPHRPRSNDLRGLERVLRERDGRWHWRWDPAFLIGKAVDTDGMAERMEQFATELHAAAQRLTVPTLLVRGGQSDLVSAESVRAFLSAVPHAEYVDVADTGHMVAGDDNDAFSSAVEEFLGRVAPPR